MQISGFSATWGRWDRGEWGFPGDSGSLLRSNPSRCVRASPVKALAWEVMGPSPELQGSYWVDDSVLWGLRDAPGDCPLIQDYFPDTETFVGKGSVPLLCTNVQVEQLLTSGMLATG